MLGEVVTTARRERRRSRAVISSSRRALPALSAMLALTLLLTLGVAAVATAAVHHTRHHRRHRRATAAENRGAIPAPNPPARLGARCPGADAEPDRVDRAAVERALLCLVNQERAHYGLGRLNANRQLQRAALVFAHEMVGHDFFSHITPGGQPFTARLLRSGYVNPVGNYLFGENLGWGSGPTSTPRELLDKWMASAPHRANVLDASYRDAGVGVTPGIPAVLHAAATGGTFVLELGARGS
jgi:uncharacterized protein YkwD